MSREELRATLGHLRSEIDRAAFRDPEARDRVSSLIATLERALSAPEDEQSRERVREQLSVIEQLEAEHPQLTAALSRVIGALSSMGI